MKVTIELNEEDIKAAIAYWVRNERPEAHGKSVSATITPVTFNGNDPRERDYVYGRAVIE